MYIQEFIEKSIKSSFDKIFQMKPKTIELQQTKKEFEGDITLVVFPYVKELKMSPKEIAEKIGSQVQSGTFFMNRCDYLDPALSWTGVKETGKGCSLSEIAYEKLTAPKSFHLRKQQ